MAGYDNSYSRLIFWLKILLPLAALAILSTMFLVARTIDPSRAIPFAKVDVNKIAREARISEPNFAGVTQDGTAVTLTATEARPDPKSGNRTVATNPNLRFATPSGAVITAQAKTGEIDKPANLARMQGAVKIGTSSGYHATAALLSAALDKTRLEATGAIEARGPLGTITSDRLLVTQGKPGSKAYVLVFTGNVKLVYSPVK